MFLFSLSLAVLAQLLSALTVFIDKYVLVSKEGIKHPAGLTFFTALLSGAVLILVPFGVIALPNTSVLFFSLLSAIFYIAGLLFLYRVLQAISVTDVIPITAAAGAIATGLLATLFLADDLPLAYIPAFLLFVVGTFLIYCFCFSWRYFFMAVAAGAAIGISTFFVKLVFAETTFFNALFWPLIMNVFVAVCLLAPFRFWAIVDSLKGSSSRSKGMVVVSKSLGGLSFFLTFVAIATGSVSLVSALGGLQLFFLFILVPLFARQIPSVFKHELMGETVYLKVAGVSCIVAGLGLLFL